MDQALICLSAKVPQPDLTVYAVGVRHRCGGDLQLRRPHADRGVGVLPAVVRQAHRQAALASLAFADQHDLRIGVADLFAPCRELAPINARVAPNPQGGACQAG